MGIANIDCEVITMGTLATCLEIFSIFCVVIVCVCVKAVQIGETNHMIMNTKKL